MAITAVIIHVVDLRKVYQAKFLGWVQVAGRTRQDMEIEADTQSPPHKEPAPQLSMQPPGGAQELAVDSQPAPSGTQWPVVDSIQPDSSATLVPPGGAQGPAVDSQQLAGDRLQPAWQNWQNWV